MQTNKDKPKLLRRLKIIEGQVKGIREMVSNDTYCIDIITQTSAVKQALSNIEDMLIENHLQTCLQNQMKTGQMGKATDEILKVYKLKRK
jgi:DNA-binding FrmR family transcriptional regulator